MASKKQTVKITPEQLFEYGAHFGHVIKRWNPKMGQYIWGKRSGIHIFDLEKTAMKIEEAASLLRKVASEDKRIVLVGTKRQARDIIRKVAEELGIAYISERWLGGTITNWQQIKTRIDKLTDLKNKRDSGELKKYTKREQMLFDKEIDRLERFFGGLTSLKNYPEVVVVVDSNREKAAVREARIKGATVIAIVDSNGNPDLVDAVIPMNDDATAAIELVVKAMGQAIAKGKGKVKKEEEVNKEKKSK